MHCIYEHIWKTMDFYSQPQELGAGLYGKIYLIYMIYETEWLIIL